MGTNTSTAQNRQRKHSFADQESIREEARSNAAWKDERRLKTEERDDAARCNEPMQPLAD